MDPKTISQNAADSYSVSIFGAEKVGGWERLRSLTLHRLLQVAMDGKMSAKLDKMKFGEEHVLKI